MSRAAQLQRLAAQLDALSAAGDWRGLADADREVGVSWRRLSARGPWTAEEQVALAALRSAHRAAAARCAAEAAQVRERMNELAGHKEGWMAYAASSHWEGERA